MLDRGGVDHIHGEAAVGAVSCRVQSGQAGATLGPLCEHGQGVVDVEVVLRRVVEEIRALSRAVFRPAVAGRRRGRRSEERPIDGRVKQTPFKVGRPVSTARPPLALRFWESALAPRKVNGRKSLGVFGFELHRFKVERGLCSPRNEGQYKMAHHITVCFVSSLTVC